MTHRIFSGCFLHLIFTLIHSLSLVYILMTLFNLFSSFCFFLQWISQRVDFATCLCQFNYYLVSSFSSKRGHFSFSGCLYFRLTFLLILVNSKSVMQPFFKMFDLLNKSLICYIKCSFHHPCF